MNDRPSRTMTEPLISIGKMLILLGLLLAGMGAVVCLMAYLSGRVAGWSGLPGDIVIRRPGLVIYIPLATAVLLSVLASLILTLLAWLWPHR